MIGNVTQQNYRDALDIMQPDAGEQRMWRWRASNLYTFTYESVCATAPSNSTGNEDFTYVEMFCVLYVTVINGKKEGPQPPKLISCLSGLMQTMQM